MDKVLYAAQFLDGEPIKAFEHLENINMKCYDTACQRPSQTVIQFVNYLYDIESEMSLYSESQRYRYLLAKLSLKLQHILNSYQSIPLTYLGLIALAVQVEANLAPKAKAESKAFVA
ncbi:MAG: hypothetical protein M1840_001032 [Geoglossum simile]|nr:MAG: hypothetical protein M1840_001032 [Geoglossum simile]